MHVNLMLSAVLSNLYPPTTTLAPPSFSLSTWKSYPPHPNIRHFKCPCPPRPPLLLPTLLKFTVPCVSSLPLPLQWQGIVINIPMPHNDLSPHPPKPECHALAIPLLSSPPLSTCLRIHVFLYPHPLYVFLVLVP